MTTCNIREKKSCFGKRHFYDRLSCERSGCKDSIIDKCSTAVKDMKVITKAFVGSIERIIGQKDTYMTIYDCISYEEKRVKG
uniref:Uncharacterized protein n=1 Tax=viral metagenome TaxID=1070528 RepID=A0A6H1ZDI9_9ZZZZ